MALKRKRNNMADVGRPTELTDELRLKIKSELIDLEERPTMAKISELTGIEYTTVKNWVFRNYKGFAEFLDGIKRDWKLARAQENIEEFLTMDTENTSCTKKGDTFTFDDPRLKKIKADATFFVAETLGKKRYSKRSELTGADGKDLPQPLLQYVFNNDGNKKDNADEKENTDSSGGNVSEQINIDSLVPDTPSTERQDSNIN